MLVPEANDAGEVGASVFWLFVFVFVFFSVKLEILLFLATLETFKNLPEDRTSFPGESFETTRRIGSVCLKIEK